MAYRDLLKKYWSRPECTGKTTSSVNRTGMQTWWTYDDEGNLVACRTKAGLDWKVHYVGESAYVRSTFKDCFQCREYPSGREYRTAYRENGDFWCIEAQRDEEGELGVEVVREEGKEPYLRAIVGLRGDEPVCRLDNWRDRRRLKFMWRAAQKILESGVTSHGGGHYGVRGPLIVN